jgi:uncharacterized repeat protein (TIGR01451 family)
MTLNVAGNFTLGNSGIINCSPGKLSIVAGGNVTLGNTPNACANITAGGNVQVGNNGFITGNIVAGGGISLGNNTNVDGICTPAPTGGSCGTPPSLTKVASTSAAAVGDTITFTITAQNLSGSAVSSIAITDVLPAGMVYSTHVTTLGTALNNSGTVTWSIPSLPAGGSAQLTLVVSLTQQGSKTNTVTSPGATSASATVLVLASAITHFKLDEPVGSWAGAAGEVLDSGGTALHGKRVTSSTPTITNTLVPAPTIASQYSSVVGGFCNAATFDGKAVVEVAESPLFDYTNKLSASVWIYPTAYPASDLYSILSNDKNYEFHLNPSGRLFWWWGSASFTSATVVPLNKWTHIAITLDSTATGGRQKIYINGVADTNTNNWKGTLASNGCKFYIGGDVATGSCAVISARNFRGMIDEVKLYNYELSAAEVQAAMTLGRNCSGGYDHIRIEHDGSGSICTPESVTVKACLNASCSSIYTGNVTVNLSPSGWVSNPVVLTNGIGTASLSKLTAGNVTLGTVSASPAANNVTRCFNGSTETCTMNFATASCAFDAVETAANPKTRLYTKLAGTAFNVDVLALTGNSVNTTYTGTVAADLVDATASSCPAGAGSSLTTAQNLTFVAGNAGRKPVSFTYAGVAKNVRVRMVVGSGTPACSTDNFAIRPGSVTLSSSANATAPGATATPIVKAGSNFDLTAAATSGYGGTITLDTAKLTAQTTTQAATVASGGTVGTLTPTTLTVNASPAPTANASYGEVGYLYLAAGAFRDETFTAVDQPTGCAATSTCDCVTDSTSDNYLSTSLVGSTKRYGCFVGSGASNMGRFVPDHFDTVLSSACGTFSYSGQLLPLSVTARNLAGGSTANYQGVFAKTAVFSDANGAAGAFSPASLVSGDFSSGVANLLTVPTVKFTFTTKTTAPATLQLRVIDTDAVSSASGSPVVEGTGSIRSGRLWLGNAYGSDQLALTVPVEVQYWNGSVFVKNTLDSCTALAAGNIALGNKLGGLSAYAGPVTVSAIVGGVGTIGLAKPAAAAAGSVDVMATLGSAGVPSNCNTLTSATPAALDYLSGKWCGASYNRDPVARATFGIAGSSSKKGPIYIRESY